MPNAFNRVTRQPGLFSRPAPRFTTFERRFSTFGDINHNHSFVPNWIDTYLPLRVVRRTSRRRQVKRCWSCQIRTDTKLYQFDVTSKRIGLRPMDRSTPPGYVSSLHQSVQHHHAFHDLRAACRPCRIYSIRVKHISNAFITWKLYTYTHYLMPIEVALHFGIQLADCSATHSITNLSGL